MMHGQTKHEIVMYCLLVQWRPVFISILFKQYNRPHFINIGSFTYFQSDDTRCCNNTICPPEDEHIIARNMLRIIM